MSGGSQQLRLFRRAIRDGASLSEACAATDNIISEKEGAIYLAADAKNPPGPECFELLYDPNAKEPAMAKEDGNEVGQVEGEYKRPDAVGAFKIFDGEIKPKLSVIAEKRGDCAEPYSRIKDTCNFPRAVMNFIVALENMESDKRDHNLLALSEGLKARRIFMPRDLVTMANGEEETNVVPIGQRRDSGLGDLAGEMASDEFEEMAESEMAQQAGRPSNEQAQAEAEAAQEAEALEA